MASGGRGRHSQPRCRVAAPEVFDCQSQHPSCLRGHSALLRASTRHLPQLLFMGGLLLRTRSWPCARATARSGSPGRRLQDAGSRGPWGRVGGQRSVVMQLCRGTGTSGKPPSCLHGHSALCARVLAVYGRYCSWAVSYSGHDFGRVLERPHGSGSPVSFAKTRAPLFSNQSSGCCGYGR